MRGLQLILIMLVVFGDEAGLASANAQQQGPTSYTETVLFNFSPNDGLPNAQFPGSLINDASGNLYGTASYGGVNSGGVVFKLDTSGKYTVLHSFCFRDCPGGSFPSGLIRDASGILYGTTGEGGAGQYSVQVYGGGGTIFKLDAAGNYTILYNFCSQTNCSDGYRPQGGVVIDSSGNLYGTTSIGGTNNGGTMFKLDTAGNYTVLYNFCSRANCIDGYGSIAGLIIDRSGNLFGTAVNGGSRGFGTVFKLDSSGNYTVLYNFCSQVNCTDGAYPFAGLIEDASGNFYGTTYNGGRTNNGLSSGGGVAFELDNSGQYRVLHNFCQQGNCTDGGNPIASLISDSSGNFYGTTTDGYDGGVFKLDSAGNYSVLHSFSSYTDAAGGFDPLGSLAEDAYGTLYGIDSGGGAPATGIGMGAIYSLAIPGFSVAANATNVTIVSPGGQGTTSVTVTPRGGFNQTITFGCSGLPTGSSCSFSPSSVTPSSGSASTTLTITTTAVTSSNEPGPLGRDKGMLFALSLPGLLILAPVTCSVHWSTRRIGTFFSLILMLSVMGLSGCAGGSANGGSSRGGTPAGTYNVMVTASASGSSQSMTLTLLVQ